MVYLNVITEVPLISSEYNSKLHLTVAYEIK